MTLVSDVEKKPKFLGNIILTKTKNDDFEILDGQQRTTIIYLLIKYLECKYSGRFKDISLCDLVIESFVKFSVLFDEGFDLSKIDEKKLKEIRSTDNYEQYDKYFELWNEIDNCSVFKIPADATDFRKNLMDCQVNVIISTDSEEGGIERFLDVNLKGIKLDTEDIFKGYLCAQDNSKDIHVSWSKLKKLDAKLNINNQQVYPFMIVIEHYMRCKLMSSDAYKDIEFNTEFKLMKEQTIEGKTYSQDTHLIAVIHNKTFLKECLEDIEKILTLITSIKDDAGISNVYRDYLENYNKRVSEKKRIDDKERDVMFNLTKKILLDKDKAPKCLLIKYFIDVFLNNNSTKQDFQKIYAVSTFALLFSLFESKKDLETIKGIIKHNDWYQESCTYIKDQLENQSTSSKTIKVAYKEKKDSSDNPQKFRCKTLATIYDYFEFKDEKLLPKSKILSKLNEFLNDETKYSFEHFVVNDSGKIEFKTSKGISINYKYPPNIVKYKNSLLNYIFISEELNGKLKNEALSEKVNKLTGNLKGKFKKGSSDFSKMVVDKVKESFNMPDLNEVKTSDEAIKKLDSYYKDEFEDQWISYMKSVFNEMRENL